jgi:hypothetical protein
MTPLSAFGLFAVTAMLVTYALEKRSAWFVLAFAVALCTRLGLRVPFKVPGHLASSRRSGQSLQSAAGGTRRKSPNNIPASDRGRLEGLTIRSAA